MKFTFELVLILENLDFPFNLLIKSIINLFLYYNFILIVFYKNI